MPDLDVRITSMYPPGVQGGSEPMHPPQSPGVLPSGESKSSREVRMGFYVYAQPENTGWIQGYLFSCDGGIPQRAETSGIGSVWRGTVHGTGIYLTDSTPQNPGQNMV